MKNLISLNFPVWCHSVCRCPGTTGIREHQGIGRFAINDRSIFCFLVAFAFYLR